MTQHMAALFFKDLRLHWKGVVLCQATVLVVIATAVALLDRGPGPVEGFVVNVNGLCVLLWGEWFISREKTKGTFAWLRTLPIRAGELCGSKFAVSGVCVLSLWVLTSFVFLRTRFFPAAWPEWLVVLMSLQLFDASVVASRWLLRDKLGQLLPPGVLFLLLLAFLAAGRHPASRDILAVWETLNGKLVVLLVIAAAYTAVCWTTVRLVAAAETRRFVE